MQRRSLSFTRFVNTSCARTAFLFRRERSAPLLKHELLHCEIDVTLEDCFVFNHCNDAVHQDSLSQRRCRTKYSQYGRDHSSVNQISYHVTQYLTVDSLPPYPAYLR